METTRSLSTLEHETLLSERLRSTILAIFFAGFGATFAIFTLVAYPEFRRLFGENIAPQIPPLFFFAIAFYCMMVRGLVGRFLRKRVAFPTFGRYMNSLFETSIPTIVMLYLAQIREPAFVLLYPPPFVYFIFIILSALRLDIRLCVFIGSVASIEYGALAVYFLHLSRDSAIDPSLVSPGSHIARVVFLFVAGIVTGFVARQIQRQLTASFNASKERDRVANIFGQHVSPQVVDKLLSQNADLLSESRHVCMMFLDIRDFTRFSQNKKPVEVVQYLNLLFESMIDIINRNNGIINKFLGDGFMAVFGAPLSTGGDVQNATTAALEIIERLAKEIEAGSIPPTRIGIGLHAGVAVTGHVGSLRGRKEYTIIGDVVNLASRIEQLNKEYASQLLVSEDVWKALEKPVGEQLGTISVRGRDEPVKIYRLA